MANLINPFSDKADVGSKKTKNELDTNYVRSTR